MSRASGLSESGAGPTGMAVGGSSREALRGAAREETAGAALEADIRVRRGSFLADVQFLLPGGQVLALLGPNGAGKSTILAALAGLLAPQDGTITVDGQDMVAMPPSARGVGLLGQDPELFPHLSAMENIAFGPRASGVRAHVARDEARRWLERVGLSGLGLRRPSELSGGQQQRVAIARALAARPRVLLLDEPFASLDIETAPAIRALLHEQLRATGTTAVLVTHDILDAVVLAEQTLVLVNGRVVDQGPTGQVLTSPRTSFTAAIAGVNLVLGVAEGGVLMSSGTADGAADQDGAGIQFTGMTPTGWDAVRDGTYVAAVFRPSSVIVGKERPAGASPRNSWPATITGLEQTTGGIRLRTGPLPIAVDLTAASVAELELREGARVWLSVKAAEVSLHER